MRLTALVSGALICLAAGAAEAYERYDDAYGPPAYEDAYGDDAPAYDDAYADEPYAAEPYPAPGVWADDRGLYMHGHRGEPCGCLRPPCGCADGLTLSSSFFDGAGGVGPIPDGGYYGGGYYIVGGGGASSHAFASASARASASVRVSYRGGHYRPHHGHRVPRH